MHTGKLLPLTPRRSPLPGVTPPTSRALLWFPLIWGTVFLPVSVATCFRNTLQARLSVTSRGGPGWAPCSPASVQSQPAALQSTLSCRHFIWKLTVMTAAPLRAEVRTCRGGTSGAEKGHCRPRDMSSGHASTGASVLHHRKSSDPSQYPLKLAGDDKTGGDCAQGPRGLKEAGSTQGLVPRKAGWMRYRETALRGL